MNAFCIALSGVLFPGLGHMLLGLRRRGVALFLILTLMFLFGVTLHPDADKGGGFYSKYHSNIFKSYEAGSAAFQQTDRGRDVEGPIDSLWRFIFIYGYPFFVGLFNYLAGFLWQGSQFVDTLLPFKRAAIPVGIKDIGDCFALLSGLLNLLVMLDAYDLAVNRQLLARLDGGGQAK